MLKLISFAVSPDQSASFKIYLTENLVFFIKRVANDVSQIYLNAFCMLLRIFKFEISCRETWIINKEEEK